MENLTVKILAKEYQISCPSGSELELQNAVNYFLGIYDSTSGNIDISGSSNGILKAKKVLIPTGNLGLVVGNSSMTDNDVITSKLTTNVIYEKATSIQYATFSTSQTGTGKINIADTTKTLILNPSVGSLTVDLSSTSGNTMRELEIINISAGSYSVVVNVTTNWIDSSIHTITIPAKKNCKLKFLNDTNTTTIGWYLVNTNGCTVA